MERIRGIVLRTVKYGDTGHIVDMFTDCRGRMSFVMKRSSQAKPGNSKKAGSVVPSLFLPLSLIEFDCDIHGQNRLPQPKNVRFYHQYHSLQMNPIKSTLSLFVAEFLINAIKEEGENRFLYDYLEKSLQWLDSSVKGYANFHLVLLIHLTRFIGIYPNIDENDYAIARHSKNLYYYDLMNCEYHLGQPAHPYYLIPEEALTLPYLLKMNFENMHIYGFSRRQRQHCLEIINTYYRLHLPGFGELKSLEILKEIFD